MDQLNQSDKQKKISFATSVDVKVLASLLSDCRTQIKSIVADDEFKTLINALTLELETNFIQRVVVYIDDIRQGKLHEKKDN